MTGPAVLITETDGPPFQPHGVPLSVIGASVLLLWTTHVQLIWIEATTGASRYKASARSRSSCSKALAMRLISAGRAPIFLAVSRQVAVTPAFALGRAAFGSLHETPPPGIWRRVADRAEDRLSGGRDECAAGHREGGLKRKAPGIIQPPFGIFEEDGLLAPNPVASGQADLPRPAVQINMDLEVSHGRMIPIFA